MFSRVGNTMVQSLLMRDIDIVSKFKMAARNPAYTGSNCKFANLGEVVAIMLISQLLAKLQVLTVYAAFPTGILIFC